ncbi:VOC family protein [Saccharopolyspora sp. HNM0983]|uniref:VOC family protein n=1 Tax=Saccharopolyspora montiporae TaxID=2781240 RepID=A0A929G2U5_9PSEU|nr:VOC family protein [Saccharopolyspora sp. HNM0983]MBE9376193.1 VOC family protein [Saccharopolyspora sp. HNM0983]
MHITRLQFVSVPVADQDAARDFYIGVLGFALIEDTRGPHGQSALVVAPAPGTCGVALVVDTRHDGLGAPVHLQFHTSDLDADVAALRAAGVAAGDPQHTPAGRVASFTDVDGNPISLLQP